ncbi:MAG: SH3 domain-containing protein [Caldilineaceae bacterium]
MRNLFKLLVWFIIWPLLIIPKLWRIRFIGKLLAIVWSLIVGFVSLSILIVAQLPVSQQSVGLPRVTTPVVNALAAPQNEASPTPAEIAPATVVATLPPIKTPTEQPSNTATLPPTDILGDTATPQPTVPPPATATPLPSAAPTIAATATATPPVANAETAQVSRVIDGDTIEVLIAGTAHRVRYIGIDTPEQGQPGYQAASAANWELVAEQRVYLVKEISDTDRYGRLLRQVYLADGRWVNGELAAQGWTQPVRYPPDILKATELEALTLEAAQAQRGFWSGASAYDGAMSYALSQQPGSLRKGPGTDFEISGNIPTNTPLTIFGRNEAGDWVQVRLPDRTGGWMEVSNLRVNVAVASIPVPNDLPKPVVVAPLMPTANRDANLRAGPGTDYTVIGGTRSGDALQIVGKNSDGSWYKLSNDAWIAASLVNNPPTDLAVASAPPPSATATPVPVVAVPQAQEAVQPAVQAPAPSGSAKVIIQWVNYDGQVYRVESDEFAVIANVGNASVNIGGWLLNAGDNGQNFVFPSYDLAPGQSVRVYTDENHPDSGGFSFGSGKAIWNNKGDCGVLYDQARNEVAEYCY